MGKRLRVQRRGRGSPTFRAPKKGRLAPASYPPPGDGTRSGMVRELHHEPGRGAPLARIDLGGGDDYYVPAPEGVYIGQSVDMGGDAPVQVGNVMPIGALPEGTMVCNVELKPGDGGRIARSSGSFAIVVSHTASGTVVKMPSKRNVELPRDCRATVGIVAGGGRKEKPFMKAGESYLQAKAKGQVFPKTKGISMAAASHPHGGGRHRHPGSSTTVSRSAPPGSKVGLIAARSSGKRKRRRRRE
ncbi:50S ribosomal protein L2 [miscellaneous Crenarchaeota group-15 archaeon DG-45]|uniref:Large ribosomal subunit protein uL2 n=1 Tax=miscellaneous Crenarchaeota group-15 archaeon DG-45 TaxID=1685127 RepID=A0A0M0BRV6_9ARCH|nr:MAG: 50S ribosomal protein L2 [miscellaneous Crenarchaeota group-15 archaeon DG-45]